MEGAGGQEGGQGGKLPVCRRARSFVAYTLLYLDNQMKVLQAKASGVQASGFRALGPLCWYTLGLFSGLGVRGLDLGGFRAGSAWGSS